MKAYCLKRGRHLLPHYTHFDKARVKDRIGEGFRMTFKELIKEDPRYSIVRVELREIT